MERAVENARFPVIRALKYFDFYFQPSINRQEILDLQHMGFLEKAENIIFIGNSGVEKTHLTTAHGVEACHQGIKSIFINCHELIQKLQAAYEKGTLERVLKRYANYELLIDQTVKYNIFEFLENNDWVGHLF